MLFFFANLQLIDLTTITIELLGKPFPSVFSKFGGHCLDGFWREIAAVFPLGIPNYEIDGDQTRKDIHEDGDRQISGLRVGAALKRDLLPLRQSRRARAL